MWKIVKETRIPMAYELTYGEVVQIKEKYESGEADARFDAIVSAFKYGFALAQRMEANKRKRGVA